MSWDTGVVFIALFSIALYLYVALCFRRIAENLGIKRSWYAWVPILDVYLWCRICGKGVLWTVLLFIPVVNFILYVILSFRISRVCNRGRLFGFLLIIPPINIVLVWFLAFSKKSLYEAGKKEAAPEPEAA